MASNEIVILLFDTTKVQAVVKMVLIFCVWEKENERYLALWRRKCLQKKSEMTSKKFTCSLVCSNVVKETNL